MSDFFSSLSCCWFWLLAGLLIGWLLNRYLCRCCCKPNNKSPDTPPPQTNTQTSALVQSSPASSATTETAPTPAKSAAVAKPKASKPAQTKSAKTKAPAKTKTTTPKVSFDLAAAKAAGFSIKHADDLTVIEGIGPKINELFKDNGIKTFADLAKQTVPQMRAVLDKGGARYRIANPATWAQQADLAANNKWGELKKLQDELSGGVKK